MSMIPKKARKYLIAVVALALIGVGFLFPPGLNHIQLPAEGICTILGFTITNTIFTTWIVMLVLVLLAYFGTRQMKEVPSGLQGVLEPIVEYLANMVDDMAGREKGKKFFPLVATIFIFVLAANWMGLLPLFGSLGIYHEAHGEKVFVPILRSAATDLNTTVGLALIAMVTVQVYGVRYLGLKGYLSRFFTVKGPIDMFVGLLELISEFAKIISLSFRLFGNVFAGEVLLGVIAFLVPWVMVLPFMGLELFVGVMQAFIFAVLTLIFLVSATVSHEGSHEEAHEASREVVHTAIHEVAQEGSH